MKKIVAAILTSFFLGFIGLLVGIFLDEFMDGTDAFICSILVQIVFVIVTMGAFVLHSIEKNK